MRRSRLLLIALLGALLLAACGQRLPTAEEIVERMEAARAATNDAHATVALDVTTPDRSGRMVVEAWMQKTGASDAAGKPINRVRMEVREASEADLVGSLMVSDGETFWLYNPAENTVITGSASQMREAAASAPTGPAPMLQDLVAQGLDAVQLEVLGAETVAGKNTWKVKVTPQAAMREQLGLEGLVEGFLWVDEELALPLKATFDASDFGRGSVEALSLETNTGLSADLFRFTPPPGATVVRAEDLAARTKSSVASLDEARAAVSFPLREPGYLPAGMALVEVRLAGPDAVILNYAGAGGSVSVVQGSAAPGSDREPPAGSQTRSVTVRGADGLLITGAAGQGSLLRWEEGGLRYVVAGAIGADEALKIAESLR
jgi:outer membrane lipoprotein-sorting protein